MQVTCSYPGYIRTEVVFGPQFLGPENRTRNEAGITVWKNYLVRRSKIIF
jgi:hypothetical protein